MNEKIKIENKSDLYTCDTLGEVDTFRVPSERRMKVREKIGEILRTSRLIESFEDASRTMEECMRVDGCIAIPIGIMDTPCAPFFPDVIYIPKK